MKLIFKKNDAGDVEVTMFKGTSEIPFSYIEMIKALLEGKVLDRDFDKSIPEEEQVQIECVLKEIETTAKETLKGNQDIEPDSSEGDEDLPF